MSKLVGILSAWIAFTFTACSDNSGTTAGQNASPPDFAYGENSELRSNMDELGFQLALLDRELRENEFNQIDQPEVVSILQQMEMAASSFQAEDAGEGHDFLQEDLAAFLDSITAARVAAAERPPRYYLAGRVAGGCVNCHDVNR
ncbi:MAG: hypothetical protein GKR91_10250 [Pseudomonadales bacterium]|nr:hypothetical protein [Pseudomonadales bacterium]